MSSKLEHSYGLFIQASPEQVWEALTDSKFTKQYFFDSAVRSDWRVGSAYAYTSPDGAMVKFDGEVIVADQPRRLVQTLNVRFDPALANRDEMILGWDIEQAGEACLVTVRHRAHEADAKVFGVLSSHCEQLLSGMKTLLETGKPLRMEQPAPARA
jgi:uncharacterized protein YndB with AHSA1/START domain